MRNFKLPSKKEISVVISSFKKGEWLFFIFLSLVLLVSTLVILQKINKSFTIAVPMRGGTISEGIVGTPRFINPILAGTDADRDLVSLIYGGLMRKDPNGNPIPDLAQSVEISKDGLTYTFILKDKINFHDKKPITADDVVFTINAIKDPIIKSPRKGNWDGVDVEKVDEKTVKFTLRQPFASFLENTTIGIIPSHIWANSPIELNTANTNPIGSGPYKVAKVNKLSSGAIDSYDLTAFKDFSLGAPYIKNVTLKFYSNEDNLIAALKTRAVDQVSSITPANAVLLHDKGYKIESSTLPRVFGLFFNQNENQLFTDKIIIQAIDTAINKDKIVSEVLSGYGVTIEDPIPSKTISHQSVNLENNISREEIIKNVQNSLAKDGWKIGASGYLEKTITNSNKKKVNTVLSFSISTGNAPELANSAQIIKENLEAIGMKVDVKTFEVGNLNQSVIRPRKYDALLFGQIINNESDLFAFWHSSQRKDPGLNVAMYTNAKVDKILEDAFTTLDPTVRAKKYVQFEDEIKKDMPAVFLYSPDFVYVVSKDLAGFSIQNIVSPSDRFLSAYLWYTKVDNVWKIFSK